jgi:GNAT superfamily N-acetyltransferase/uncharacterized protein YndB with AHSA1/START domain
MKHFRTRIDINQPPARVWAVLSDVARWPRWTASVQSVDVLDPGPLKPGTRVRIMQPRLRPAIWTVTSLVDGWAFTWDMHSPGVRAVATHQIEPAPGGSRVTLTVDFAGVLALPIGWLTSSLNRRYMRIEAEGLKRESERRFAVRDATIDDVPEIVRVTNLAYRVEDFFVNGNRTSTDDVRARMTKAGAGFLAVDGTEDGGLAASVYYELRGDRIYFGLLAVDPSHRSRGLARRLIEAVEQRGRAAGCRSLDLDVVNLREELPAFYEKLGFRPSGTADFVDKHKLTRDAHLVLMSKPIDADGV